MMSKTRSCWRRSWRLLTVSAQRLKRCVSCSLMNGLLCTKLCKIPQKRMLLMVPVCRKKALARRLSDMASVYELDAKISSCIQLDEEHVVSVDDGEILNLQQFEALQMERDAKVEGLACYIKNKLADAEAIYAEIDVLSQRAAIMKKEAERCKAYLAGALYGEKFETPRCKITWRKSEICNVLNIDAVPEEYKRTKVTVDADKTAIKKAIKSGAEVPGAEVIQKLNMTLK
nr:MAG TPA: resistance protein [Caudoviricetes sp.]